MTGYHTMVLVEPAGRNKRSVQNLTKLSSSKSKYQFGLQSKNKLIYLWLDYYLSILVQCGTHKIKMKLI
jgi:hypothetical protein